MEFTKAVLPSDIGGGVEQPWVAGGRWQVAGGRWQVAGGRWQVAGTCGTYLSRTPLFE